MFSGHIFSSSFWRSYWVALRRSRRDRRDLKNVVRFTAALLLFVGYYGYVIGSFAQHGAGSILLLFLSVFTLALFLRWISNRRDEKAAEREDLANVNIGLRNRLAEDGFVLATLLTRASSEAMLKQKELPPGVEVITRRAQIEKLKSLRKWDTLPGAVRRLLLLPDGHWSQEQIQSTYPCFEILRCLRWTLYIDDSLTSLTYLPKMNYETAQSIFENPQPILDGTRLRPTWDIRVERNQADAFFSRCLAEAIGRGLISASSDETKTWAYDVSETARQPEVRDLLAGINTIAEIDDSTVRYLGALSLQRFRCLQVLLDLQLEACDWKAWDAVCLPTALIGEDNEETEESTILF